MKKLTKKELNTLQNWKGASSDLVEGIDFTELKKAYLKANEDIQREMFRLEMKLPSTWARADIWKYKRNEALMDKLSSVVKELALAERRFVASIVKQSAAKGYGILNDDAIAVDKETVSNLARTNWSGKHFSKRILNDKIKLINTIEDKFVNGVNLGKSISQLTKDILTSISVNYGYAERLVRTEAIAYFNIGARERYHDAKIEEVIWLSAHTCDICSELDGQVFPIDEAPLAVHPNCKCTIIPKID